MTTLNNQSSLLEITESIRHINEVFLPSVKQKLASKTHFGAENTFEQLINNIALDKIGGRKLASGSTNYFRTFANGEKVTTLQLDFIPRTIIVIHHHASGFADISVATDFLDGSWRNSYTTSSYVITDKKPTSKEVPLYMKSGSQYIKTLYWFAIE